MPMDRATDELGTICIPDSFLLALGHYNRLGSAEWPVLLAVASRVWRNGKTRPVVSISRKAFTERTGAHYEAVRRALKALLTPAGTMCIFGADLTNRRMGHGMLQQIGYGQRGRPARYRLVLDWRLWGWPDGSDVSRLEAMLSAPPIDATPDGVQAARLLHEYGRLRGGTLPSRDDVQDLDWRRWCQTMDRLLARGWDLEDITEALDEAALDDHWSQRLATMDGADLLEDHLPGLLLRARRRDRSGEQLVQAR
jgi:hypothetical protein